MISPKISVIMSIYNESESQIRESIESIIAQTFTEFEYIIVNDNPSRIDIEEIINSFYDERIKYFVNENNIGLAMSMNRAAKLASSDIFARMDADDIAFPERIQKEYDVLITGDYDFVFSGYNYIDDNSIPITNNNPVLFYKSNELNLAILSKSIIHHPTVMMNRSIFEQAGGYRDFPCSQDADLWYRMLYLGCRFYMLPENLLHYRINPNSVSRTRKFKQWMTLYYIDRLFIQRIITGKDSYSKDNYEKFLMENGGNNFNEERSLENAICKLSNANHHPNKIISTFKRFLVFISSRKLRLGYLTNKLKVVLWHKYIFFHKL